MVNAISSSREAERRNEQRSVWLILTTIFYEDLISVSKKMCDCETIFECKPYIIFMFPSYTFRESSW